MLRGVLLATHPGALRQGCLLHSHPNLSVSTLWCKHGEEDGAAHGLESQYYTKVLLSQHLEGFVSCPRNFSSCSFGRLAPPITVLGIAGEIVCLLILRESCAANSFPMLNLSLTLDSQAHQRGQSTYFPLTSNQKNLTDLLPLERIHNLVPVVPSGQHCQIHFDKDVGLYRSPQQVWLRICSTD